MNNQISKPKLKKQVLDLIDYCKNHVCSSIDEKSKLLIKLKENKCIPTDLRLENEIKQIFSNYNIEIISYNQEICELEFFININELEV